MTSKKKPLAGADQARKQGASKTYPQGTHFVLSGQVEVTSANSVASQRKRIFSWLSHSPLTTLEARQHLDCMHPAARIMKLRKRGLSIETVFINDLSHRKNSKSSSVYFEYGWM